MRMHRLILAAGAAAALACVASTASAEQPCRDQYHEPLSNFAYAAGSGYHTNAPAGVAVLGLAAQVYETRACMQNNAHYEDREQDRKQMQAQMDYDLRRRELELQGSTGGPYVSRNACHAVSYQESITGYKCD